MNHPAVMKRISAHGLNALFVTKNRAIKKCGVFLFVFFMVLCLSAIVHDLAKGPKIETATTVRSLYFSCLFVQNETQPAVSFVSICSRGLSMIQFSVFLLFSASFFFFLSVTRVRSAKRCLLRGSILLKCFVKRKIPLVPSARWLFGTGRVWRRFAAHSSSSGWGPLNRDSAFLLKILFC